MIIKNSITVEDSVFKRLEEIVNLPSEKNTILRISVLGGGCSGFKYSYDMVSEINNDDIIFEKNGLKVVVDSVSQNFMADSVLSYVEDLGSSYFEIKNPNASSKCGCGSSFSI